MSEDDIASALPRPPLSAPARREAAIEAAMRRFDGKPAAAPSSGPRASGAGSWWPGRPYAGALAGALLVAVIALPVAWVSLPDRVVDTGVQPGPDGKAKGPAPVDAGDTVSADAVGASATAGGAHDAPSSPAAKETLSGPVELADAGPRPGRQAGPAEAGFLGKAGESARTSGGAEAEEDASANIIVTGSRVSRPNVDSPSPVTSIGSEEIRLRSPAAAARRGDWNECTIDDPRRDPAACRKRDDRAAKSRDERSAAQVADGLSSAWQGNEEAAMASFDRAIETAPRSATAYLNRGLAYQRAGDLDRALADLDRAVRLAPSEARTYYHRSILLRRRGEVRRARFDERKAVELDPDYGRLVGRGR